MIRKLHFTHTEEKIVAKKTGELGDYKDCVAIRTIETKTNPSDLTLNVEYRAAGGTRSYAIALADYKTKFEYINETYVLDAKKIPQFNDTNLWHQVNYSVSSVEKNASIDVSIYYFLFELEDMLAQ